MAKKVLELKKSTPTSELIFHLLDEVDKLRDCPVDNTNDAKVYVHNIARISRYINKRWSH